MAKGEKTLKSLRLIINKNSKLTLLLLLLLGMTLSTMLIDRVYAQTEVYMVPASNPPAPGPSVGFKWNITLYVKDVADLNAYEVTIYYNKTAGINATRAWRPTWDPQWVFVGRTTVGVAPVLESWNATHNRAVVGDVILVGATFSGNGKLGVVEFEIIAAPPKGKALTTSLNINNVDTILEDSGGDLISRIATDGNYLWVWTPPTTKPYIAVSPTLVEYGPYPPSAVGQAFDIDLYVKQLDSSWGITNATFTLSYNTTVIDIIGNTANITLNTADWNGINSVTVTPGMTDFTVRTNKTLGGNVLVATIKFTVMNQEDSPPYPAGYSDRSNLTLSNIKLMDHMLQIPTDPELNGLVKVYALIPLPPPSLEVQPQSYTALYPSEEFDINVTIRDLDEGWKVIGVQFRLLYNASLVEVLNVTEGPFLAQFNQTPTPPYTFSTYFIESNGLYGPHVVFFSLILPNDNGQWNPPFPNGNGTIATIRFNVTGQPPGSFFMTLNDTIVLDNMDNEIAHNLAHGFFELPGLNVTITDQPAASYQRTQTASMKFRVQYPNRSQREGTYFTANDLGTITVGVYNGSKYIANVTLTTADFNSSTNKWTVNWKAPWNATLSNNYKFTVYSNRVIDKLGSSGPPLDVSSSTFGVIETTLTVPSIFTDKTTYKRGSWVTISFQATYPDGSPVTTGRATIIITRPDGTWAQNITANYVAISSRFETRFWLADNEQLGTGWNVKLAINNLADGASPPNKGPTTVKQTTFTTVLVQVLDVQIDVGTTYFKGEQASFIALAMLEGQPINATTITAILYKPDGTATVLSTTRIATGVYKASYIILATDPDGTYTLIVQASYITASTESSGAALKSFLVSSTLTDWNAKLTTIEGDIGVIQTDIGTIKVNLNDINASIVAINGDIVTVNSTLGQVQTTLGAINAKIVSINGTVVTINTTLGQMQTTLGTINGRIVSINGTVVTINTSIGQIRTTLDTVKGSVDTVKGDTATVKTTLGDVQTSLGNLQSIATMGITAASILSAIAAIVAIMILLRLRKK